MLLAFTAERPFPDDDAGPFAWLLFHQEDVVSTRQALRHMSEAALRYRVRSGQWRRVARHVYTAHRGPLTEDQRLWVAVLAAGRFAVLGGLTAAARCGLRGFRSEAIHILRPASLRGSLVPPGIIVHRTSTLTRPDINRQGLPPHTLAARSLVDAAAWARDDDAACALIAAGFQQRLVTKWDMFPILDRLPRLPRRAEIWRAVVDAAGGSESLPEMQYLRASRRSGLPEPTRQARRRDTTGRTRYLDVYYATCGVHVEIDGGQHMEVRATWADMKRQNDLWIAGDRVLRFPAWLVRQRPDEVIGQVRIALTAAGWRP